MNIQARVAKLEEAMGINKRPTSKSYLPTLEEWEAGIEARKLDTTLNPGEGMFDWEARVPAHIVEDYKKVSAERMRQAQETLAIFEGEGD